MNNKKKIILTSAITIATCLALITGSTFALFTDDDTKLNVAITAGDFDVTATPVKDGNAVRFVTASELKDSQGQQLAPIGVASFEESTNKVSINNMVPGDYITFYIDVTNNGSVAADCTVKFEKDPAAANDLFPALTADLYVLNDSGARVKTVFANKKLTDTDFFADVDAFTLESQGYVRFEIAIKFPNGDQDGSHDNQYIGKSCGITYSVFAVQHNEPANP